MLLTLAHRGFSGLYPENTMLAFAKAIDEGGADGVETDVHLSADGEMVLIHDDDLDRTTNGLGMVGEHTLAQLRALDAGQGERIPLLAELLEFAKRKNVVVNVELKNTPIPYPGLEQKVIALARDMGMVEHVKLSSFNHESMAYVKQIAPDFYTGLLYENPLLKAGLLPWNYAKKYNANALNPYYKLLYYQAGLAKNCAKHGIELNAWTVNEPHDMARVARHIWAGSIITNYPDRRAR
jgi:glycerophosphoryl diester phosphodiesterase